MQVFLVAQGSADPGIRLSRLAAPAAIGENLQDCLLPDALMTATRRVNLLRRLLVPLCLLAVLALAACGNKGPLRQPDASPGQSATR